MNKKIEDAAKEYARNNPSSYPYGDEYFESKEAFKTGAEWALREAIEQIEFESLQYVPDNKVEEWQKNKKSVSRALNDCIKRLEQLLSSEGEK